MANDSAGSFNWGSSWTHDLSRVQFGLTGGVSGYILDDLAALILLPAFIVIQARSIFQLYQSLKPRFRTTSCSIDTANTRFGVASVVLFAGYVASSIVFITTFAFKLSLLLSDLESSNRRNIARWLDLAAVGSAHLVILTADGLLVYRCYIACHGNLFVWGSALLTTILSAGIFIASCVFIGRGRYVADPLRSILFQGRIVCSVIVNLIVTVAIAVRLREAEQQLRRLSSVSGTPYKTAFCIFLDSALPPTILGVIICAAVIPLEHIFPDRPVYTHWLIILWFSCTALAPQLIAVRVLRGQSWDSRAETPPILLHDRNNSSGAHFKSTSSAERFQNGSMTEVGDHGSTVNVHSISKPYPKAF